MLKTAYIIEDEKPSADRLQRLLKNLRPKLEVIAREETVTGAVALISGNPPVDVIFMDIRLADGLSFEIFNQVEIQSRIIFTTAYDQYAVRAFRFNSIDYLLKPIEEGELDSALVKCENSLKTQNLSMEMLQGMIDFIRPKEHRTRFLLPYRDSYRTVLVKEIIYFNSEMGITRAYLQKGDSQVIPQTLEELEKQLDPKLFFRANRQFILHIDSIIKLHNYFNGKLKVELRYPLENEIIVSREKATQLKNWMDY